MSIFSGTRRWVYPQSIDGRFQTLHRWSGRALMAFLVVMPWITIGGHPAARIDVPARRVYALGSIYTATDGFLVVLFALSAAFSLFFFTSLFGRLWCGYACPQTVFLEELIRPIERAIEGERPARMKRDAGPWTPERVARKAAKLSAFAAVAVLVSMCFVTWFAGRGLWTGAAGTGDYALVGVLSSLAFADFAWFREQLCVYLCPYARFQGALTDAESLVVSYDRARGEPRGGKAARERGGCVACEKCVTVCPQGIDIRDGYQLECINCARCVDACAEVMGKLDKPSLVRYTTIAAEEGKKPRWIRPRTVAYASLLTGLAASIAFVLATHQGIEATVTRQPGTLYTVDPDGWVRNTWIVRVASRDSDGAGKLTLSVEGLEGAEVLVPDLDLASEESRTVPLVVRVPPSADMPRTVPIRVRVSAGGSEVIRAATFKTPGES